MNPSRRDFLRRGGAAGVGLLAFDLAGCERRMTPAAARRAGVPLAVLNDDEAAVLDALGEVLVPGSAEAGLVNYVDHQLHATPVDCMLMIRYLNVAPPFLPFYRGALQAVDDVASAGYGTRFARLAAEERSDFVGRMAQGKLPDWQGPPAGFVFFVLRADAVDVVYGTPTGFEKLAVPYMAHIPPPSPWGA